MNKYNENEKVFFYQYFFGCKHTYCGKILAVKKTMFSYSYVIKIDKDTFFYNELITVKERNITGLAKE